MKKKNIKLIKHNKGQENETEIFLLKRKVLSFSKKKNLNFETRHFWDSREKNDNRLSILDILTYKNQSVDILCKTHINEIDLWIKIFIIFWEFLQWSCRGQLSLKAHSTGKIRLSKF